MEGVTWVDLTWPRWFEGYVAGLVAPYCDLLARLSRRHAADRAAAGADLVAMLSGGLTATHVLDPGCSKGSCEIDDAAHCARTGVGCRAARSVGIVVQPDGDVLLCLPPKFGATLEELESARALCLEVHGRIRRLALFGPFSFAPAVSAVTADAFSIMASAGGMAKLSAPVGTCGAVASALLGLLLFQWLLRLLAQQVSRWLVRRWIAKLRAG